MLGKNTPQVTKGATWQYQTLVSGVFFDNLSLQKSSKFCNINTENVQSWITKSYFKNKNISPQNNVIYFTLFSALWQKYMNNPTVPNFQCIFYFIYILFNYNSLKLKVLVKTFYLYQTVTLTSQGNECLFSWSHSNVQEDWASGLLGYSHSSFFQ